MIQRVLSHDRLAHLSCIGLILFLLVFIGAIIWVFRRESLKTYHQLSHLPFEENDHV